MENEKNLSAHERAIWLCFTRRTIKDNICMPVLYVQSEGSRQIDILHTRRNKKSFKIFRTWRGFLSSLCISSYARIEFEGTRDIDVMPHIFLYVRRTIKILKKSLKINVDH